MLRFRKFPVAKKFMDKRGGESFKIFRRKFYVSQCQNFPWGESFSVSLISSIGNIYASEGCVTIFDFLSNFFVSVPKNLVGGGESFSVSLISGIEKVWIGGGGGGVSRFSVGNFLSHSAENFRRGEPFSVSLISGI